MERSGTRHEGDIKVNVSRKIKNLFLSPVYVKRTENNLNNIIKPHCITESCTQTSKTIIELAKLEAGYISPDSLNSTPRSHKKCDKERDIQCRNLDEMNVEQKSEYHLNKLREIVKTSNDEEYWQENNFPPDKEFQCTAKTFSSWPAEVIAGKPQEKPILLNLVEGSNQNSLMKQFLTQKKTSVPRKRSPFYLQNKNNLRSQSFIEAPKKMLLKHKYDEAYNTETKPPDINLRLHDLNKNDLANNSAFHSKRSNSFMSPTLASEIKSQKQVVDSVRNLVSMTCKGRSVSPSTKLKQNKDGKIPYIDQSKTNLEARQTRSEELDKKNLTFTKLHVVSSSSSIVGSNSSSDNGLMVILSHIKSADWNLALKGLAEIVEIAKHGDSELFLPFMSIINQRLLELLRSPRSHVTRTACQIAGHLFETMKDTRRPEFDDIVNILLYKTADASKFIRQDANLALDCMVTHIPTFHAIRSLCSKGPTHRNPLVRCAAVRLLICSVVIAGTATLLNNPSNEHSRKRVVVNLVHFLADKHLDTRKYAERLYRILAKESSFDFYLKKYLDRTTLDSFYQTVRFLRK